MFFPECPKAADELQKVQQIAAVANPKQMEEAKRDLKARGYTKPEPLKKQ